MGAFASNQGRIIDRVGQVDNAVLGFSRVLGSTDGNSTRLARSPADETMYGFLSNKEGYATLRFAFEGPLEDESIDKLDAGDPRC